MLLTIRNELYKQAISFFPSMQHALKIKTRMPVKNNIFYWHPIR